jgi:hypothetical protein
MRVLKLGLAVCALALVPQGAEARDLTVVSVSPQGVACAFTPACGVTITETVGYFKMFGATGYGRLRVRTYPGVAGAQAAGLTGYSYYVDLRGVSALGMANCVKQVVLDAGPVVPLKYSKTGTADMFMVEAPSGVPVTATQNGSKITVKFAKPVCSGPAGESLYFGFAAKRGPVPAKAQLSATQEDSIIVDARLPAH